MGHGANAKPSAPKPEADPVRPESPQQTQRREAREAREVEADAPQPAAISIEDAEEAEPESPESPDRPESPGRPERPDSPKVLLKRGFTSGKIAIDRTKSSLAAFHSMATNAPVALPPQWPQAPEPQTPMMHKINRMQGFSASEALLFMPRSDIEPSRESVRQSRSPNGSGSQRRPESPKSPKSPKSPSSPFSRKAKSWQTEGDHAASVAHTSFRKVRVSCQECGATVTTQKWLNNQSEALCRSCHMKDIEGQEKGGNEQNQRPMSSQSFVSMASKTPVMSLDNKRRKPPPLSRNSTEF